MSTKIKTLKMIAGMLLISTLAMSQTTVEMPLFPFPSDGNGITSNPRVITFLQDVNNAGTGFTPFTPGVPPTPVTMTVSLGSQTYTGLPYINCPTGIIFGAAPTDATTSGGSTTIPTATPISNYSLLGAFNGTGSKGPQNNMFNTTLVPVVGATGTGMDAIGAGAAPNGGVSVFTATQALFNGPGGLQPYNNTTKYEFGTIVLTFSQFVSNPIIHFAGLGGAYRYQFQPGDPANVNNWKSTFFTTELELISPNRPISYMSGNPYFEVSGQHINNTAANPNGGSAPQIPLIGIFDNYGAASGSVRVNGIVQTLVFKVTIRGGANGQFPWSALKADIQGSNKPPFTGDIWSVAASFAPAQLIPLPSTGVHLEGALNGNDVQLSWKTQTELNSENFEIERSTDGTNFTAIGTKAAAGNSATERNYDFQDRNMTASIYYYRLRLNDIDARYTYSNIVTIRKAGGIKDIRVYPNPAVNNVSLEFNNAKGNYVIRLYNQAGQEVMNKVTNIQYNVQTIGLERGNLPAGYYMIQISNNNDGSVRSEKVIFQ